MVKTILVKGFGQRKMMAYIKIKTPENIDIEYRLASLGLRTIAYIIDVIIQNFVMGVIVITIILMINDGIFSINNVGGWVIGLGLLSYLVIVYGYWAFFEYFMKGMTPGKRLFGIRVIRKNGQPVTLKHTIIRNLFKSFIDPIFIGPILMFFNKEHKRIGDMLASTVVVTEEKLHIVELEDVIKNKENSEDILEDNHDIEDLNQSNNYIDINKDVYRENTTRDTQKTENDEVNNEDGESHF